MLTCAQYTCYIKTASLSDHTNSHTNPTRPAPPSHTMAVRQHECKEPCGTHLTHTPASAAVRRGARTSRMRAQSCRRAWATDFVIVWKNTRGRWKKWHNVASTAPMEASRGCILLCESARVEWCIATRCGVRGSGRTAEQARAYSESK